MGTASHVSIQVMRDDPQAVSTAHELCDDAVSAASLLRCSWHRSKVLDDFPIEIEIIDDDPIKNPNV